MATIVMYTKENCPYCTFAKQFLTAKKLSYTEIRVDLDQDLRIEMEKLSGRRTVPQIFINGHSIGGYDDLTALAASGKLDILLDSKN